MKTNKQQKTYSEHKTLLGTITSNRETMFSVGLMIAVVLTGVCLAWALWGQTPMPHADAPHFFRTGHELLNLQWPSSFKRAPVLGLAQASLSILIPGERSDYYAGLLLNALLYPGIALLIFLILRQFMGDFAFFPTLLLLVNPWALVRLTEGIAETPLLFITLLTIYLMIRRSPWVYLCAGIAAMTRYESVILIFIALGFGLYQASSRSQRYRELLWAGLALVPLGLWMLGTALSWEQTTSHYIKHYTNPERQFHFANYFKLIWQTSVDPLLRFSANPDVLTIALRIATVLLAGFGMVWGILKQRRTTLIILIFLAAYLAAHFMRDSNKVRYYAPLAWIVVLFSFYGVKAAWQLLSRYAVFKKYISPTLLILLTFALLAWINNLQPVVAKISRLIPQLDALPIAMGILMMIVFIMRLMFFRKQGGLLIYGTLTFLTIAMVSSNQTVTIPNLYSTSQRDIEFIGMLDWYHQHAQPGAKLMTALPEPLSLLDRSTKETFMHTGRTDSHTYESFTRECLDKGVTYVTWDSRIGFAVNNSYYKKWHIEKLNPLILGQTVAVPAKAQLDPHTSHGPPFAVYNYLTTIHHPDNRFRHRFIHIYELKPIP